MTPREEDLTERGPPQLVPQVRAGHIAQLHPRAGQLAPLTTSRPRD